METTATPETRRLAVSLWVLEDVRRELSSRVRVRFTIDRPAWWNFSMQAGVTMTGPARALDEAVVAIHDIEAQGQADASW